ncbi:putative zinc-binding protein [Candidatus Colwellia aromaticivorans]|uniref:putative zinc-binding protein n=1 Tax=Candidatus Colwellia aromaticivorans TaxID=2267621 RepID=UPI001B347AAE|nr:putative zinc-binding protein [Candidatus Colwellia aromaticivorans]
MSDNKKIEQSDQQKKPIVYSCSGCSNLAQMAHNISLNLDGDGIAEMSCVAGVIGKVGPIMDLAKSGRPIIAIDGCGLSCTKSCLEASGLKADHYYLISDLGFEKRNKWNDSLTENTIAMKSIYDQLFEVGIGFKQQSK